MEKPGSAQSDEAVDIPGTPVNYNMERNDDSPSGSKLPPNDGDRTPIVMTPNLSAMPADEITNKSMNEEIKESDDEVMTAAEFARKRRQRRLVRRVKRHMDLLKTPVRQIKGINEVFVPRMVSSNIPDIISPINSPKKSNGQRVKPSIYESIQLIERRVAHVPEESIEAVDHLPEESIEEVDLLPED